MFDEDVVCIVCGLIVCLFLSLSVAECTMRYAATDFDCWLARDPIICQKIKDGVKQLYYNGGIYAKHPNLFTFY